MSTTTTSSRTPCVQWLIESRPPGLTCSRPSPSQPNQPPLDLTDRGTRRCRGRGPERPRRPGEHGEGTLGGSPATRAA